MNLLERDDLLGELRQLLQRAGEGSGSMVLLAGEAGSGKTSVVHELQRSVGDTAKVLIGHCDPLTTPRPLGPLLDIAGDPDSGFSPIVEEIGEPVELFADVVDLLKDTIRPTLLVLEDIHWADEATLDLLRFVGRRVGQTKALVLGTFRNDEVGSDHPLRLVLGDLASRDSVKRLQVEPLSLQAVTTLSRMTPDRATRLHRLTGGNAFFVTEIISSGEEMPSTVQDAVLARIMRLAPGPRRVVESASIVPRVIGIEVAADLAGTDHAHVDAAVASGMLVESRGGLSFRHELARSAVEESLPPSLRLGLHRRMIGLVEEDGTNDYSALAHHAARAEASDLVARYAPKAAVEASLRGAHREAADLYRMAISHGHDMEPSELAHLRLSLGKELGSLDHQVEALEQQQMAVDYFRRAGDDVELADSLVVVSTSHWRLNQLNRGRLAVEEAIGILEPMGESPNLAYAWWCSSYHWMLARKHAEAMAATETAKRIAADVGDGRTTRLADFMLGTIETVTGDTARGVALLRDAYERALDVADMTTVELALEMLGTGAGEVRLYEVATEALENGIELSLQTDADYLVTYEQAWMSRIAFEQAQWERAVEFAEMVIHGQPERGAISPVTAWGALGRVRVRRGDPGARDALERSLEIGKGCEMQHLWSPLCGLAEMAWLEGRLDDIPVILEWIFDQALRADSVWARGEVGFWMWKAGAIDSAPGDSAQPYAAQIEGDWRAAAEMWREIGCPYEVAFALADGDGPAMLEAISILDSLGARPLGARVRSRLRDSGVASIPRGPSLATRSNRVGLTRRQQEVLDLMSQGLSNADIAARLYISKKTVEHHVSAVLSKLGVDSRAKAIVTARAMGVTQN